MIEQAMHLVSCENIRGDSAEDTKLLRQLVDESRKFLCAHQWCVEVLQCFFGGGIGGVVGIFLMHIKPRGQNIDEWLWTVVGDLPPAYLVMDRAKVPSDALKVYIEEMSSWISAAKAASQLGENIIPVRVDPTPANARALQKRLDFLEQEIIPMLQRRESSA